MTSVPVTIPVTPVPERRGSVKVPRGRNQEIITNIMVTKHGPMTLEKITELARSMNDKQDSPGVWHALNVLAAQGRVRKVKKGVYEWIHVGVERPVTQVWQPVGGPLPVPITVKAREEKPLFSSIPNCNDCLTPMTVCTPDTPRTGVVLLTSGIHYTCTNRECPAGKSKATPVSTSGIQDLLVRAQTQSLEFARTLGQLSEIIGPFLIGLDGLLRAKGENDGSGKD